MAALAQKFGGYRYSTQLSEMNVFDDLFGLKSAIFKHNFLYLL
jgi:hypothetical protein